LLPITFTSVEKLTDLFKNLVTFAEKNVAQVVGLKLANLIARGTE